MPPGPPGGWRPAARRPGSRACRRRVRRPSKPSVMVGWPPMTWARPQPAKVMMRKPMPTRLLPRPSSGWRNTRKAKTSNMGGSSSDIQPKVPLTIPQHGVRQPARNPHQAKVAMNVAEHQVEQGGAVAAVLGREVADVGADPPDSGADHVADAQPCAGQHPHQPRLAGLTAASCRVRAVPAAPRGAGSFWTQSVPEPRPEELPDLPLEGPLGAGEERVAIPATVPEAGPKTRGFPGRSGNHVASRRHAKTALPACRSRGLRAAPGRGRRWCDSAYASRTTGMIRGGGAACG